MDELKNADGTNSGLDADLLDGRHLNGIDTLYATNRQFVWCGWLNTIKDTGEHKIKPIIEDGLKKICAKYPNMIDSIFCGVFPFYGNCFMLTFIYDTSASTLDAAGLPEYAFGIIPAYNVTLYYFRVENHVLHVYTIPHTEIEV